MKNKLYYILFPLYIIVFAFILLINGVFGGNIVSVSNLVINVVFLFVIGVLFAVSCVSFGRLNYCSAALCAAASQMQKEYRDAGEKNLWESYRDRKGIFADDILNSMYAKYRMRINSCRTKRGCGKICDIGEFINEDLMDKVGKTYFNSGVAGTLTGLGILGTFLGLALGLSSFQGNDIYTISDNVGPLLTGMKVAFHTSVYGIFFSLVFNFVYRGIMADAYDKLDQFLNVFRLCVQPAAESDNENSAAILVYQANMANSLKQMLEISKGVGREQTEGLERIVNQFMEQMNTALNGNFRQLGDALKYASDAQTANGVQYEKLTEAISGLVQTNQMMQKNLEQMARQQEAFSKELSDEKEKLQLLCDDLSDQISTQLYTMKLQSRSVTGDS